MLQLPEVGRRANILSLLTSEALIAESQSRFITSFRLPASSVSEGPGLLVGVGLLPGSLASLLALAVGGSFRIGRAVHLGWILAPIQTEGPHALGLLVDVAGLGLRLIQARAKEVRVSVFTIPILCLKVK